jgi:hypothetical protein
VPTVIQAGGNHLGSYPAPSFQLKAASRLMEAATLISITINDSPLPAALTQIKDGPGSFLFCWDASGFGHFPEALRVSVSPEWFSLT